MYSEWERLNPDDGVGSFSSNPFNPKRYEKDIEQASLFLDDATVLKNFVIEKICENVG